MRRTGLVDQSVEDSRNKLSRQVSRLPTQSTSSVDHFLGLPRTSSSSAAVDTRNNLRSKKLYSSRTRIISSNLALSFPSSSFLPFKLLLVTFAITRLRKSEHENRGEHSFSANEQRLKFSCTCRNFVDPRTGALTISRVQYVRRNPYYRSTKVQSSRFSSTSSSTQGYQAHSESRNREMPAMISSLPAPSPSTSSTPFVPSVLRPPHSHSSTRKNKSSSLNSITSRNSELLLPFSLPPHLGSVLNEGRVADNVVRVINRRTAEDWFDCSTSLVSTAFKPLPFFFSCVTFRTFDTCRHTEINLFV